MKEVTSGLKEYITQNEMFKFDSGDIDRMRTELHNIVVHVTNVYHNHRVIPVTSEQDQMPDSDNEVEELVRIEEQEDRDNAMIVSDQSTEDENPHEDDEDSITSEWTPPQNRQEDDSGSDGYDHLLEADFIGKIVETRRLSVIVISGLLIIY